VIRLGLKLSLSGGRDALIRLVMIAASVVIGVTVVLFTFAGYHALSVQNNRPCWECTYSINQRPSVNPAHSSPMLWLYNKDYVEGQAIERLDVAALGPRAPLLPGIPHLPTTGEFYASPALITLMRSLPADELRNRFPGQLVGTIGDAALTNPRELVAFVGLSPHILEQNSRTITVHSIGTAPDQVSYSLFLKFVFLAAGIGLLFPMLVLIGTATRLSATRREQRFAAMRLVGATQHQIRSMASIDAFLGSSAGALGGIALFVVLRMPVGDAVANWLPFFVKDLTPTLLGYIIVVVGVPILAVAGALLSLRRVAVSPMGITRRTTPSPPGSVRVLPLALGATIFLATFAFTSHGNVGQAVLLPMVAALLLTMIGLVTAGPWLVFKFLGLLARRTSKVSRLLAVRRLADNPQAAFRAVSGVVLAAFVGALFASISTAIISGNRTPKATGLTNTLSVMFYNSETAGLPAVQGHQLMQRLERTGNVQLVPIYAQNSKATVDRNGTIGLISCTDLRTLPGLGKCQPGVRTLSIVTTSLVFNHSTKSLTGSGGAARPSNVQIDPSRLPLQALLVTSHGGQGAIERIRTILAGNEGVTQAPETFGEALQADLSSVRTIQRLVDGVLAITLIVAGCSLAVAAGGGLAERKRPFTLLRVTGMPLSILGKVMLFESAVPLLVVTIISAAAGIAVAADVGATFSPPGSAIGLPTSGYFVTLGIGLVFALALVGLTLPFLGRMTQPESVRFE